MGAPKLIKMNFLSTKRRSQSAQNQQLKADLSQGYDKHLSQELAKISKRNEQLVAFSEHISRQIRSTTGNLSLTVEFLEQATSPQERNELLGQLSDISKSMSETVTQLNQMVHFSRLNEDQRENVALGRALSRCLVKINDLIQESEVEIFSDFSEVPEVAFNAQLLESFFEIIIKHSIVHPVGDRQPTIDIFSYQEQEQAVLLIKDNSEGHGLAQLLDSDTKDFNSETEESHALTLAGLKLQVEQLGGQISVKANAKVGTSIRLKF